MGDLSKVAEEARKIVDSGQYSYGQSRAEGYLTDNIMDCSEFVYHSYRNAGFLTFPALDSKNMALTFQEVTEPQVGDIVYWSLGHVAIIENPTTGDFLGAQSTKSGLKRANYKTGWWSNQAGRKFLHYGE